MIMDKRYQRGEREIRVSQFFSLTGLRDCVFLSSPNARKRNSLALPLLKREDAPLSGFRPRRFRFTPRRTRRRFRLGGVLRTAIRSIEPSPFLFLRPYFHIVFILIDLLSYELYENKGQKPIPIN